MKRGYELDDRQQYHSVRDVRIDDHYGQQNDRPWLRHDNNQPPPPGTSDVKYEIKEDIDYNPDEDWNHRYDEKPRDLKSEDVDPHYRRSVKDEQAVGYEEEEEEEMKFFCGVCDHTSYSLEVYML